MPMFNNRILRLIPDQNAVLEMNFGKDYETQMFIKGNTPKDAVILAYGGITYYSQRDIILIDSYKVAETYKNIDIDETMDILHKLNVSYILYKSPGWDEQIFGSGNLYDQSSITRSIRNSDNSQYFKIIYGNGDYTLYQVLY